MLIRQINAGASGCENTQTAFSPEGCTPSRYEIVLLPGNVQRLSPSFMLFLTVLSLPLFRRIGPWLRPVPSV